MFQGVFIWMRRFFRKMCGGESDNEQKKAGNKRKHWRKPTKIYQIRKRK